MSIKCSGGARFCMNRREQRYFGQDSGLYTALWQKRGRTVCTSPHIITAAAYRSRGSSCTPASAVKAASYVFEKSATIELGLFI